MDWHNLPQAMRDRDQWICTDETKHPRNPKTGQLASVSEPSTWTSFQDAVRAAIWNAWDIAYVITADDPFTIIDLDNKPDNPAPDDMVLVHRDIILRSNSYVERSISGTGYHVIVKGKPPRSIKTPHIEQYGHRRYMICTGDIVTDSPVEVAENQELLDLIDHYFGKMSDNLGLVELTDWKEEEPVEDDQVIYDRAANAENGDKFLRLWQGDMSDYGNDHSSADSALLNLLCFYTPHNEQVRRLFRQSALYRPHQRNKQVQYMNYSIGKWRAENAPLDLSHLVFPTADELAKRQAEEEVVHVASETPDPLAVEVEIPGSDIEVPPGVIGELARFCYQASYRPVKEASVATAIGYVAGLIGRSYHVNGVGLNQYLVFLAESGVGKEGAKKAIRMFHNKLAERVPPAYGHLASGDFSAGVSLVKELADTPCCLSLIGEVGQNFQVMLDPKAPSHLKELKKAMLEAWSESGPSGFLNSRRYSDKSKNASDVRSPCWSCLGESVPQEFYRALNASVASDGFIPRFLVFEYPGDRQRPNRQRLTQVPEELLQKISDMYVAAKSIIDHGSPHSIQADQAAGMILASYEEYIDECIRAEPKDSPTRAILNRCYEKSMRLAGLFAVANNPYQPIITKELASAAIRIVERADKHMLQKFKTGEISTGGSSEDQFVELVTMAVRKYIVADRDTRVQYKCPAVIAHIDVIPLSYLKDQLRRRQIFKEHPKGILTAINLAIKEAQDLGILVKVGAMDRRSWGINQDCFRLGEGFRY